MSTQQETVTAIETDRWRNDWLASGDDISIHLFISRKAYAAGYEAGLERAAKEVDDEASDVSYTDLHQANEYACIARILRALKEQP